jgi:hypothetical protein
MQEMCPVRVVYELCMRGHYTEVEYYIYFHLLHGNEPEGVKWNEYDG